MLESFLAVLAGRPSDEIVWTADLKYWMDGQKQAGAPGAGECTEQDYLELCRTLGCMPYYWYENFWLAEPEYEGVEVVAESQGARRCRTWRTSVGELREESLFMTESVSEAFVKHAVENESDLRTLLHILERRRWKPAGLDAFGRRAKQWAEYDGIPALGMIRSPLASFLHEWAGMGNGSYLICDHAPIVREILSLMEAQERPIIEATCRLRPPLVHFPDNLSSESLTGLFGEFMAEPYRKRLKAFHSAGIRCAVHLDGRVRGLLPKLTAVGMDAIEALTPFPAGDVHVEEMRSIAGSDKVVLWGGVPGVMFVPPYTWSEMKSHLAKLIDAWRGTPFVVGVGDQVPPYGDIDVVRRISDYLKHERS